MKPKRITSYHKLSVELKKLFGQTFKEGFAGQIIEFKDPRNADIFKAVELETDEFFYLVNVEELLKTSSIEGFAEEIEREDRLEEIAELVRMESENEEEDEEEISDEQIALQED